MLSSPSHELPGTQHAPPVFVLICVLNLVLLNIRSNRSCLARQLSCRVSDLASSIRGRHGWLQSSRFCHVGVGQIGRARCTCSIVNAFTFSHSLPPPVSSPLSNVWTTGGCRYGARLTAFMSVSASGMRGRSGDAVGSEQAVACRSVRRRQRMGRATASCSRLRLGGRYRGRVWDSHACKRVPLPETTRAEPIFEPCGRGY